jgi:hypothetical protein
VVKGGVAARDHELKMLAYLGDVLIRVHEHPNSRIDEPLPHRWSREIRSISRDLSPSRLLK